MSKSHTIPEGTEVTIIPTIYYFPGFVTGHMALLLEFPGEKYSPLYQSYAGKESLEKDKERYGECVSIKLPQTTLSSAQLTLFLDNWKSNYNLVMNNCSHFVTNFLKLTGYTEQSSLLDAFPSFGFKKTEELVSELYTQMTFNFEDRRRKVFDKDISIKELVTELIKIDIEEMDDISFGFPEKQPDLESAKKQLTTILNDRFFPYQLIKTVNAALSDESKSDYLTNRIGQYISFLPNSKIVREVLEELNKAIQVILSNSKKPASTLFSPASSDVLANITPLQYVKDKDQAPIALYIKLFTNIQHLENINSEQPDIKTFKTEWLDKLRTVANSNIPTSPYAPRRSYKSHS